MKHKNEARHIHKYADEHIDRTLVNAKAYGLMSGRSPDRVTEHSNNKSNQELQKGDRKGCKEKNGITGWSTLVHRMTESHMEQITEHELDMGTHTTEAHNTERHRRPDAQKTHTQAHHLRLSWAETAMATFALTAVAESIAFQPNLADESVSETGQRRHSCQQQRLFLLSAMNCQSAVVYWVALLALHSVSVLVAAQCVVLMEHPLCSAFCSVFCCLRCHPPHLCGITEAPLHMGSTEGAAAG